MYGPRSKMLAHLSEFGEWPIRPGFKAVQAAIARVAKIDRETAYEIRHSPLSTKELSAMHNLSKAQIRNIKRGLSWAPLGASVFSVGAIPPRPTIGGARKDL